MGEEKEHEKVKLVIPVLFSSRELYESFLPLMEREFGEIDFRTEPFLFQYTHYYDGEMGTPIYRVFLSFARLIDPMDLIAIKKKTNLWELEKAVEGGKRKVNLDPGYMQLGKFILATTKDQQHRVYAGQSIFLEVTLYFRSGQWCHWEWTYPDYRSDEYKKILFDIREIYRKQLR